MKLLATILVVMIPAFVAFAGEPELSALRARIAAAESAVTDAAKAADREFDAWADKLPEGPHELNPAGATGAFDFDVAANDVTPSGVAGGRPGFMRGGAALLPGRRGDSLRLPVGGAIAFPGLGHFTRSDAFTLALWMNVSHLIEHSLVVRRQPTIANGEMKGYDISLRNGRIAFGLYHDRVGNLANVVARKAILPDHWTHIAVTYDGSSRAAGMKIFVNGEPCVLENHGDALKNDIVPEDGKSELAIGFHADVAGPAVGYVDEFRVFDRALASIEIASLAGRDDFTLALQAIPQLNPVQRTALLEYYIATTHQASIDARSALNSLRDEKRQNAEAALRTKR